MVQIISGTSLLIGGKIFFKVVKYKAVKFSQGMEEITNEQLIAILKDPPTNYIKTSNLGETIWFENLILKNIKINEHIETERYISFNNVQFGEVKIQGLKTVKDINFNNVTSRENSGNLLEITANQLTFNGLNKFEGRLNLEKCKIKNLNFSYMEFTNHISISQCEISRVVLSARITTAVFFKENLINQLLINGGEINEFHISSGNIGFIGIYGDVILKVAFITGGNIRTIHIDALGLEKLNIMNYDEYNINLTIYEVKIINTGKNHTASITKLNLSKLLFVGTFTSKESVLRIYDVKFEYLMFSNFINYGLINFSNVEISNTLHISNSDVGKLSFIGCNLDKTTFDFSKSKIIETIMIGTEFPSIFKDNTKAEDKYDAYLQIRRIFENRGAHKNALEYYALEMNALSNTDAVNKNNWEKFNLFLNRASTNHGVSWKRGLFRTILVSATFYTFYVFSLDAYSFNPTKKECWKEFFKVFSYYFEFINPAHRANIIAQDLDIYSTSFSRVIEGVSRIFIAYFIYQLIQAFRKYGKK